MSRKKSLFRNRSRQPICFWSVLDVDNWLKRQLPRLYPRYINLFIEHDINGRILIELSEMGLEEIGVKDKGHRCELLYHITKAKLRSDFDELSDYSNQSGQND